MSYYRNYRRPYYYRRYRRYRDYGRPIEFTKGIFILGASLIVLGSVSSISSGDFGIVVWNIILWGLMLAGIVFIVKKIKNRFKRAVINETALNTSSDTDVGHVAEINSEKHGCKCYMDGLTDGEQEVAHILSRELGYKDYFIFNNLTIPSDVNGSSQIDHLVVSRFGFFVIESKDYQGWIFGSEDQDQWTKSMPGGVTKFQFQNPIRQNWSHIMSLKKLVPFIPEAAFQSIVVFTGFCEIKTQPIEGVVRVENLIGYIKKFTEVKLSESDLHMALGKLTYTCQTADISPSQHIENIHIHHPESQPL